ncbi:uncharacterized protein CIMG_05001 [Coccidioides immitis RS]|uniref:Uncharacterized protein n=1 Tax=Coccidioides immitis (strain RS) TaxID=246410 RepID=J3KEP5_COCIM|nr:uncharacterized protein CIMG_05001 [Coccidioides immitis RS]EAS33977.3 hypothetical protein CIMG_05001 [Coccidioides immitis RS]TPX21582.1 hypothetical protein DIZ76_015541 [Coccidioides immitis]
MSLQTTYLVNGEWATRRVDIGEILARNREINIPGENRTSRVPATGFLSRTLVHGPAIQWVLPARIRHQNRNDVVFVGDNFIQIKELVLSGHLEEVMTKADFDAKIVGATVINTRPEVGLGDEIGVGRSAAAPGAPLDVGNLAPQILVLILASKEMIFLYAKELSQGRHEFVHARRPLPADVSSLEEYGKNITVDPRSRAMAVSAAQKFFGIFSLKAPQVMQREMACGPVNPIQEERFFRTDGDILKMEFLYPKSSDPDKAILLLLVSRNSGVHLMLYYWNTTQNLHSITPRITGLRRLPVEWGAPPILVPLIQSTSFLFVTPTKVHIFSDVVEKNIPAKGYSLPPSDDSIFEWSDLIWTQWTRPMRHGVRNKEFDDIYLCREDGKILYLEIKDGSVKRNSVIGVLDCNLDTGFSILDGGFEAGDLFVATGSMSSGGLFIAEPRKPLRCIQRIPNWAPTLDSIIVKGPVQRNPPVSQTEFRTAGPSYDRIFTCSGAGSRPGAIAELRYGLEARIGLVVDQEDSSIIIDLWAIPNEFTGGTFCLISNPMSSSLISIPIEATEDLYALDEESSGLNLSSPTLAASRTANQMVIQVTDVSINLTVLEDEALRVSIEMEKPSNRIIAATINGRLSLLATVIRSDDGLQVIVRTPEINSSGLRCNMFAQPLVTTYEPVCLLIEEINSHFYLFIGTSDGRLVVVEIDYAKGLVPVTEQKIFGMGDQDSTVCEYLQMISTVKRGVPKFTLFCGLRGGILVPFDIERDSNNAFAGATQKTPYKLGDTFVRIRGYESDGSMAIVTCGHGLWRLSFKEDDDCTEHRLDKILITDQNNPSRIQCAIDAFCCIDPQPNSPPGGLGGSLLCFAENQLFACTLEKLPKPIPREIHVPGSPRRIIYSKYLQRLVVAYNSTSYERDGEYTRCYSRPRLCFVDPDSQSPEPSFLELNHDNNQSPDGTKDAKMPTGASGEKITALFDWNFSSGEHAYHMIVVGTSQPRSTYAGRLIYISARTNPQKPGHIVPIIKNMLNYDQPVRAIASYESTSLIIGVGDGILVQSLNPATKRWRRSGTYKLESTPLSITVKEPYIYVLTARHSVCILKLVDGHFELYGQDGADREGLDHVNLQSDSKIILTSNRGGSIVGFSELGLVPDEKLLKPLFVAHVPYSLIRLGPSYRPYEPGSPETIYGTALGGTIYRFTTLKEHEWRLLRFIQNICLANAVICPYRTRRRIVIEDLAPAMLKPESMHVDGDILSRIVDHGMRFLEDVMRKNTTASFYTNRSATDSRGRMERFIEFATPVVGDVENPFAAVVSWMEDLLRLEL